MVSIVFVIFAMAFALIFAIVLGGILFQLFTVGSLTAVVTRRMKRQLELAAPKPCAFCGSTIPDGQLNCPGCGGPRDGQPKNAEK